MPYTQLALSAWTLDLDSELLYVGVALQHPLGWFGGVRSDPTTLVNLEVGKRLGKRLSVSLTAYNVLDSNDNDITYFYASQLPGESAPVADRHFHPVEPRTLRVTLETRW